MRVWNVALVRRGVSFCEMRGGGQRGRRPKAKLFCRRFGSNWRAVRLSTYILGHSLGAFKACTNGP